MCTRPSVGFSPVSLSIRGFPDNRDMHSKSETQKDGPSYCCRRGLAVNRRLVVKTLQKTYEIPVSRRGDYAVTLKIG